MNYFIALLVIILGAFISSLILLSKNKEEPAFNLFCFFIGLLVATLFSVLGCDSRLRQEAVKNGAAEWKVTIDPITGNSSKEFAWINSKEDNVQETNKD